VRYVLGGLVLLFLALLIVGAISGRVRMQSCCAVPAEKDARMRDGEKGPEAQRGGARRG